MKLEEMTLAGLRCQVVDTLHPQTDNTVLVVLNHGFGASGDDLVDLGSWILESYEVLRDRCRFVFPEAPVDPEMMGMPGARAWWPINMAQLAVMNQTKDYQQLTKLVPDGMLAASGQLHEAVCEMQKLFRVPDTRTVIGGFSQGAMCSCDVVLRYGLKPSLLALFSGTLLCHEQWLELADQHEGCEVFQSHGHQDQLLPFQVAVQLNQLLFDHGFKTEFHEFDGGHTIPMSILQQFSQSLIAVCAD